MRHMLFATAATLGMTLGVAALAQTTNPQMGVMGGTPGQMMGGAPGHMPGTGTSEPSSSKASNIGPGDTRSAIAPRLPRPGMMADATPHQLLGVAQQALAAHRTGAAQEALERAETRLLDRSTPQDMTNTPSADPVAGMISQARAALGRNDISGAQTLISQAMMQTS